MTKRPTLRALFCLLLATVVFYWQILLTRQYSLLTEQEAVNQGYSWFHFWITQLRRGAAPLWDPYTSVGHSFSGEMQTAAFYPLNLLLALFPFNKQGVFSPQLYHEWYVFAHFLGACFMFALAREMRLGRFASIVAGICFGLGGFVVHGDWPDMLQSAIWLPLVFLFFLRAMRAPLARAALLHASLSGMFLGVTILAGRIHVAIMQTLVVLSAAAFAGFEPGVQGVQGEVPRANRWRLPAVVVATIAVVAFCAGAIQLFPSMEYSSRAIRFLGGNFPPWPAGDKIPYAYMADGLWPHGLLTLLFPMGFNGSAGPGEAINPYLGVFPFFAAIVALRRRWDHLWIRYLAGLAAAAMLYAMGSYSLLHGAAYALIPRLWMAREAGRFVYLADFSLAILAGFGVETLLAEAGRKEAWAGLRRVFNWVAIAAGAALAVPMIYGHPDMNPWSSFSLIVILLSCGLFQYVVRGHSGRAARILIAGLILFDLSGYNWSPRNVLQQGPAHVNFLERLYSCRGVADFLKTRPGPFRLRILADPQPNIGDLYGIPTTSGMSATLTKDTFDLLGDADLLNVRYQLRPASFGDPNPIYQDATWKLYDNPSAYGAAWVVHETVVEPSQESVVKGLYANRFDPRRQAVIAAPLGVPLAPRVEGATEDVSFQRYDPSRLELTAHAVGAGLLVLSELYYPGWYATVNGKKASIYRVDGGLRAIAIPAGVSKVALRYAPHNIYAGAALSFVAFLGVGLAFVFGSVRRPRRPFAILTARGSQPRQ